MQAGLPISVDARRCSMGWPFSRASLQAVCVFFPAWSSAWADRRELRQQSHQALSGFFDYSLGEPFVGQALARSTVNKAIEARHRVIFDVAFIEPEGKFIDVTGKMLRAGVVIDAVQAALEDGKG